MFERDEYISFANCGLPYYIGGTIKEREALLVQTPESMKSRFNIDVRIYSEVIRLDTLNKVATIKRGTEASMKKRMITSYYPLGRKRSDRILKESIVREYFL